MSVSAQDVQVMIKKALAGLRNNGGGKGRGRGGQGNNRAASQQRGKSRGKGNNNNNKINNTAVSKLQQQLSQFKKRLVLLEGAKPPVPFEIKEIIQPVYDELKDRTLNKSPLAVVLYDFSGKYPKFFASKDPAKGITYVEGRSYYELVDKTYFHKKHAKAPATAEA